MFINLLPPNTRLKIQFRSMLRRYVRIWCLAGLGAVACASVQVWECRQAAARIAALEDRCQPLYALQQVISEDRQQLQQLEARSKQVSQLQPTDHFIDLLGVLVTAAQANGGKVHVQRLTVQAGQPTAQPIPARGATATSPTGSPAVVSTLSLNGLAEDDEALAQFVTALRQSGVFERVELRSSSQVAADSTRQYQLECRYEELP